MTRARVVLGAEGEDLAAGWYLDRGYQVVARNWRVRAGELDLVVRKGRQLVFCEVKTRLTDRFGHPAEAVTHVKRQRIRRLAAQFLGEHELRPSGIRFDVAAVLGSEIEVYEAAF